MPLNKKSFVTCVVSCLLKDDDLNWSQQSLFNKYKNAVLMCYTDWLLTSNGVKSWSTHWKMKYWKLKIYVVPHPAVTLPTEWNRKGCSVLTFVMIGLSGILQPVEKRWTSRQTLKNEFWCIATFIKIKGPWHTGDTLCTITPGNRLWLMYPWLTAASSYWQK